MKGGDASPLAPTFFGAISNVSLVSKRSSLFQSAFVPYEKYTVGLSWLSVIVPSCLILGNLNRLPDLKTNQKKY